MKRGVEAIRDLIEESTSIHLTPDEFYLIKARVEPLLERLGLEDYEQLAKGIREGNEKWKDGLIDVITTNETYFFRDISPFMYLKDHIFPSLLEEAADEGRQTKIMFAGCSSGQEPYSVAMILEEHFSKVPRNQIDLHAVDISAGVLERAKEARYSQFEVNRGLPALYLLKYFRKEKTVWRLNESIMDRVRFTRNHLLQAMKDSPPLDVVFLRNVLIYFGERDRQAVWKAIEDVLRPDGYLILGGAETPIFQSDAFRSISSVQSSIYKLRRDLK